MLKTSESSQSTRSKTLSMKMAFLEQFINITQMASANLQGIVQFESILNSSSMNLGILKPGNVYSAIFQLYVDHQLQSEALQTLNGMKATIPNFMNYLDADTVSQLCLMQNVSPTLYLNQDDQNGEENSEDIKEIINHRK
jgi:hypothetical protein